MAKVLHCIFLLGIFSVEPRTLLERIKQDVFSKSVGWQMVFSIISNYYFNANNRTLYLQVASSVLWWSFYYQLRARSKTTCTLGSGHNESLATTQKKRILYRSEFFVKFCDIFTSLHNLIKTSFGCNEKTSLPAGEIILY